MPVLRCQPSFVNSVRGSASTIHRNFVSNKTSLRKYTTPLQDPFHKIYSFGGGTEGAPLGHEEKPHTVLTPRLIDALSIHNTNPVLGRPTRKRRFVDIAASYLHAFAVSEDGEVFGWGLNNWGQIATVHRAEVNIAEPTFLEILQARKFIATACGRTHSLFVTDDKQLLSVGGNEFAQLGLGHQNPVKFPSSLNPLKGVELAMVEVGLDHSLALDTNGTVWGWGYNGDGQLGFGSDTEAVAVPTEIPVPGNSPVCYIAAGYDFSIFLTADGQVYAAGNNTTGQLGLGHTNDIWFPQVVHTLQGKNVTLVAAGGTHAFALAEDGTLYSWGFSSDGQIGRLTDDVRDPSPAPVEFFNGKQIQMLKTGGGHTLVLLGMDVASYVTKAEDGLYSFGFGSRGRLGHGDEVSVHNPKKIEFFNNKKVVNFATGMDCSFVVVEDTENN